MTRADVIVGVLVEFWVTNDPKLRGVRQQSFYYVHKSCRSENSIEHRREVRGLIWKDLNDWADQRLGTGTIWMLPHSDICCLGWDGLKAGLTWDC